MKLATAPNHQVEPTAQQLRCWVPVALRAPAAAHLGRSASDSWNMRESDDEYRRWLMMLYVVLDIVSRH